MWAVRDHIEDYTGAGVTVWGVTGHYPQLIAAWDKEHAFGVLILADYDHEVTSTYVGLYEDPLPANLRLAAKRAGPFRRRDLRRGETPIARSPGQGSPRAAGRTG